MPLQITGYSGLLPITQSGHGLQIPRSPPVAINATSAFAGSYTIPAKVNLIKIKGTGAITWTSGGIAGAEEFDGTEYRWVNPGDVLTVS
jgi:hypothetical protein